MANKEHHGIAIWIATGLGSGYSPIAPGTAGSVVGVLLAVAVHKFQFQWPVVPLAVLAGLLLAIGVWSAAIAEKFFGRVDPGQVVIDEVAGQVITLLFAPKFTWPWLLAGFLLFRIFDIIKPFPARQAEQLHGGWGIMMDDVIAGFYSLISLMLLGHFIR